MNLGIPLYTFEHVGTISFVKANTVVQRRNDIKDVCCDVQNIFSCTVTFDGILVFLSHFSQDAKALALKILPLLANKANQEKVQVMLNEFLTPILFARLKIIDLESEANESKIRESEKDSCTFELLCGVVILISFFMRTLSTM